MRHSRLPGTLALICILVGTAFRLHIASTPLEALTSRYLADDYFYYLNVAHNLAQGRGPTFDGGLTETNGFQPLFALLLTALFLAGADKHAAVHLGLIVLTAASALAAWLAFRLVEAKGRPWGGVLASGLLSLNLFFVLPSLYGFETSLAIATALAALLLAEREARPYALGAACGIAALARIDNLLLLPAVALGMARRRQWDRIARAAVCFLVVMAPWWCWSLARFGTVVPDSGAVKAAVRGPHRIAHGVRIAAVELPRVLVPDRWVGPDVRGEAPVPIGLLSGLIAGAAIRGVRTAPSLALFGLFQAGAYIGLTDTFESGALVRYLTPAWVAAAVLVGVGLSRWPVAVAVLLLHADQGWRYLQWERAVEPTASYVEASRRAAGTAMARIGEGEAVAAFDCGSLGYFSPRPVTNLDGLVNHDVVQILRRCPGRFRQCLLAYLREKGVTVLAGGTGFGWTEVFPEWESWERIYESPPLPDRSRLVFLRLPPPGPGPP
jgi:hypothetical protein